MNKKSDADLSIAGPSKVSNISSAEYISSSDSSFVAPTTKKRKTKIQAFRETWLEEPTFKAWLKQTDDPRKAQCTACSKLLTAHKKNLEEHAKSYSHMMNLQQNTGASVSVLSNATARSSDKENNSTSDSSFVAPTTKKRKTKIQLFRETWLEEPTFKAWLKQTDDPRKAQCTACSKLLTAHKKNLEEHAKSYSHMMNLQQNTGASVSVLSNATASSSDKENNSSADVSIAGPSSAACLISNGDSDSSSDSILFAPAVKKRKTKKQTFRETWMEEPIFKPWLKQTDDPHKAKCTACSKLLTTHKRLLEHHANSEMHIMNMIHQKEPETTATKKTFAD